MIQQSGQGVQRTKLQNAERTTNKKSQLPPNHPTNAEPPKLQLLFNLRQ